MFIIQSKGTYLWASGDMIQWTPIRDFATCFRSKEEAKSFKTKNDLCGHVIPC